MTCEADSPSEVVVVVDVTDVVKVIVAVPSIPSITPSTVEVDDVTIACDVEVLVTTVLGVVVVVDTWGTSMQEQTEEAMEL